MGSSRDRLRLRADEKIALLLLAAFLGAGELAVRLGNVDGLMLKRLIYYEWADQPSHQASRDLELLYELKPRSRMQYGPMGSAPGHTVTVNALGFRDPERSIAKPKGVFRIVCVGSSNTYGALVNDQETYPALLEKQLNAAEPGRYEVWNAGVNAYVLRQETALAEKIVRAYDPDLILIQHHDRGRRALLRRCPFSPYFESDPRLYREELDFLPFRSSSLGLELLAKWRLYRASVLAFNGLERILTGRLRTSLFLTAAQEEEMNNKPFEAFYAKYKARLPIILLTTFDAGKAAHFEDLGIRTIALRKSLPRNAPLEFYSTHPPAYVYRWYAGVIIKALRDFGCLPDRRLSRR